VERERQASEADGGEDFDQILSTGGQRARSAIGPWPHVV
jgi:hypothetical protein